MKKASLILLFGCFVLVGCSSSSAPTATCTGSKDVGFCPVSIQTWSQTLDEVASAVLKSLKTKDLPALSLLAGKEWIRFSPYEHVDIQHDIVLSPEQIKAGLTTNRSFLRWTQDGSGKPLDLSIGQYWDRYVYDVDFVKAPVVTKNTGEQRGNVINNIIDIYTGKQVIEYYFSWFDTQYQGMDRRSLSVIFDKEDGQWKVIGVVHGQWTS